MRWRWKLAEWAIVAAIAAMLAAICLRRDGAAEFFAGASAVYCWFCRGTARLALDAEKILLEAIERRIGAAGAASALTLFGDSTMQEQIISLIAQAMTNALKKAIPDLPADGTTQINTMVTGIVGLVWDIAKLEATKELAKLNGTELLKLFPQLASLIPATAA